MSYLNEYEKWKKSTKSQELKDIEGNDKEIKERFFTSLAFGTAGMRGVVGLGTFRMNDYSVAKATEGLSQYVKSIKAEQRGVVIAYDTRRCSLQFAVTAAKVLSFNKIKVYLYENVRPVPIISFTVRYFNAIAGIMITASHNPKEYNGYKVYGEDGAQMSPEATDQVVSYINKVDDYFSIKTDTLTIKELTDIHGKDNYKINDYITIIGNSVDEEYYKAISKLCLSPKAVKSEGKNLKIVYTPIHGAGYIPVTTILSRMNIPFSVVEEQAKPDTEFRTVSVPNPENKDALTLGIVLADKIKAGVVIGTDPDCDRMGIAIRDNNEQFVLLNGNQIGALLMDYILRRHSENKTFPKNAAVIKTIVTTSFATKIAESYGAKIYDVLTGFKFIGEKIKEWEQSGEHTFLFGYEESYGYLSGTHARDKDAVVASMLFAEMVCYYKSIGITIYERLQELFKKFGYYKDMSVSTTYSGLDGMDKMAAIMDKLHNTKINIIGNEKVLFVSDYEKRTTMYANGKAEAINLPKTNAIYYGLADNNWLCVRPSGTEPKLKIYVSISEKTSMDKATEKAEYLIKCMKELL